MAAAMNFPTEKSPKTFEEAISLTGFGKFNLFTILTTGGCLMCVIIESMSAMFIIPAAQCDLDLSLTDKGILYSINFLGVMTSSHVWGYVADTKGRKIVSLISLVISAVLSFIGSFVTAPWLFILLRFFNGFFIGGSSAITYAYAGEFHDDHFRPKVVTWIAAFVAFGNIFLPGLAWVILPQHWAYYIPVLDVLFRPWRLLMIIYTLPSVIFAILIWFMPESPKYLLTQKRHEEAMAILTKIYVINSGQGAEKYPVSVILWDESYGGVKHEKNEGVLKSMWAQTKPLFKKEYLLKTVLVCYMQLGLFLTTSSVIMWYPQILNSMSLYGKIVPPNEVTMCKSILYEVDEEEIEEFFPMMKRSLVSNVCTDVIDEEVFLVTLIIGVCYAVCYVSIGSVINAVGARKLLIGFVTITTISGICAQTLSGYTYVLITLGIFLLAAPCIGIVNAIVVDLYPTRIRGMALAISLMFGRFGAMSGSNIAGPLMSTYCDFMFYFFAAVHIVIIIVVILLPQQKVSSITADKSTEES